MPTNLETLLVQATDLCHLDMKNIFSLDVNGKEKITSNTLNHIKVPSSLQNRQTIFPKKTNDKCDFLKSFKTVLYKNYNNTKKDCQGCLDYCSIMSFETTDTLTPRKFNLTAQFDALKTLPISELKKLSLKELQLMFEDLSNAAKNVSSDLVELLLENDTLHQEIDARNIAIEQLLDLTVKNPEGELGPIQMSVILPSEEK